MPADDRSSRPSSHSALVTVIGAGLAGSQAALAAARLGAPVRLVEMRPDKLTPAHHTGLASELVCSNSLGGEGAANAKGLLQGELRLLGAQVMTAADGARIAAGNALAVDRDRFAEFVTASLEAEPLIDIERAEQARVPDGIAVLASGPLTSDALAQDITIRLAGGESLSFYDAASPVLDAGSINLNIAFAAGRYEQDADYLNCPLSREEYEVFFEALEGARKHTPHDWESLSFFEGCMPIEEVARRGFDTPRYGPMKPKGLLDPRTGLEPFACVQLRREDAAGRMWSLVGFQTGLAWPDQLRVVRLIPGLEQAKIVRYGVMHRNTYLNAPKLLNSALQFRAEPRVLAAGVLAGTEGYLESAATGWLAGLNAARLALGLPAVRPPPTTMLGSLTHFLATANSRNFQPMNCSWSLVPELNLPHRPNKRAPKRSEQRPGMYDRAMADMAEWAAKVLPS